MSESEIARLKKSISNLKKQLQVKERTERKLRYDLNHQNKVIRRLDTWNSVKETDINILDAKAKNISRIPRIVRIQDCLGEFIKNYLSELLPHAGSLDKWKRSDLQTALEQFFCDAFSKKETAKNMSVKILNALSQEDKCLSKEDFVESVLSLIEKCRSFTSTFRVSDLMKKDPLSTVPDFSEKERVTFQIIKDNLSIYICLEEVNLYSEK